MISRPLTTLTAAILLAFAACATAGSGRPPSGVRTVGREPGQLLTYVAAEPRPQTVLTSGQAVEFKMTVDYRLESADRGTIALVIQDEAGRSLMVSEKDVSQPVHRGA